MIKSMTGYGSMQAQVVTFGKLSIELRSTNHKFLETVLHSPEGFISLEEKIKKEIEAKIRRGRVTCVITISSSEESDVYINNALLEKYLRALQNTQERLGLQGFISVETLIHLPGVVTLAQNYIDKTKLWPQLKRSLKKAVHGLGLMRKREGRALFALFVNTLREIFHGLESVQEKFDKAVKQKLARLDTDEEKSSFLKTSDITEEIERLEYHSDNFYNKLSSNASVGKELDFIAQEMQREANTMGAKSCDVSISALVVGIKSNIEKIREQVQNVE